MAIIRFLLKFLIATTVSIIILSPFAVRYKELYTNTPKQKERSRNTIYLHPYDESDTTTRNKVFTEIEINNLLTWKK